jgi:Calx-beta domain/CHRD domain
MLNDVDRRNKRIVRLTLVCALLVLAFAQSAAPAPARSVLAVRGVTTTEESRVAVFKVTLNPAAARLVTVRYATANGTAVAGLDYVAKRGKLVFNRGQTTKAVRVTIRDNSIPEESRKFFLVLSRANGARIGGAKAAAVIKPSDLPAPFTLRATINGAQEAATNNGQGDPTAHGTVSVTFLAAVGQVSYTVTIEGATSPFAFAHVHPGRPPNLRGFVVEFQSLPPGNGTASESKNLPLKDILQVYNQQTSFWFQLHKATADPTVGTIGGPLLPAT